MISVIYKKWKPGWKYIENKEKKQFNPKKLTLQGFTHTRDYAKGYLRNKDGVATVTISQLEPLTNYEFEISSYYGAYRPESKGQTIVFKISK